MTKFGAHHHPHHHRSHQGLLGGSCGGWRRRNYVVVLLVLVAVLVINMLLLMPQLHASDSSGWHLVGFSSSAASAAADAGAGAAAADANAGGSAAGKTIKASAQQQAVQLQQTQVAPKARAGSSVAAGDFIAVFDDNRDGVLGPGEFSRLVQEACRNDRSSLPLLQRVRRVVRLAFGLNPSSSGASNRLGDSSAYPCTLSGELLDSTRQAAAAITGRQRGSSGNRQAGGGTGSGRGRAIGGGLGRAGGGIGNVRAATAARGAATVDPDSPEGRAAARSAALLSSCSKLTPELAGAAAVEGTLLLAAADWAMFELFGVNWLAHAQRSGLDNYLLAALDQRTADFLRDNKLGHCILWSRHAGLGAQGDGPLPKQAAPYQPGSSAHRSAAWAKLQVASVLMQWDYDVILSDLDTVWLTDPLPYLLSNVPDAADMVLATDSAANRTIMATKDPGLLVQPSPHSAVNPAVAYIKATPASQAVVSAWLSEYQRIEGSEGGSSSRTKSDVGGAGGGPGFPAAVVRTWLQQPGFAQPHPLEQQLLQLSSGSGLLRRRRVSVGLFSPVAVANSYSWFVQGVGSRAAAVRGRAGSSAAPGRKLPLAVHLSRVGSSREGRLHQMREAQWYADGPRYYSEPKLLTFNMTPYTSPAATAGLANAPGYPATDLLALHLASLQHQLQQLYAAAAVAVTVGRVLVMPAFQCYCYREPDSGPDGPSGWVGASGAGWSCRAPGDDVSVFPFNCTLDQVMSPALMYQHPPVFAGRPLNFREAGFLTNTRTPSWVRHAATVISSGHPAGCEDEGVTGDGSDGSSRQAGVKCAQALPGKPPEGTNQQVVVPAGLTDSELVTVLQPFASAKYLHFTDVTAVFGSFANPNHRIEYERWLDKMVQPWCCKEAATAAAAAAGDGSSSSSSDDAAAAPSTDLTEVPTAVPGWVMVDVKARQGSSSSSSGRALR